MCVCVCPLRVCVCPLRVCVSMSARSCVHASARRAAFYLGLLTCSAAALCGSLGGTPHHTSTIYFPFLLQKGHLGCDSFVEGILFGVEMERDTNRNLHLRGKPEVNKTKRSPASRSFVYARATTKHLPRRRSGFGRARFFLLRAGSVARRVVAGPKMAVRLRAAK